MESIASHGSAYLIVQGNGEQSVKGPQIEDRRKAPRFDASAIPTLKYISRIGGYIVKLINISRSGALIESRERISKGSSLSLRLTTENAVYFIKGRIVRYSTSPMKGRVFQSGIAFDKELTILPASIAS